MQYATPRERLLKAAWTAERSTTDPARHKCFLAYHSEDADEVADFVERFATVFIPRVIGITDADDFVDSTDADYVMDCVREKYLADSTVTIVMVGKCTWARRYVDWEIYSTLRKDKKNRLSGLMGVTLPSVAESPRTPPTRLADNLKGTNNADGYARWWRYPTSDEQLRGYIEDAFQARTARPQLIDNTRARKIHSSPCE